MIVLVAAAGRVLAVKSARRVSIHPLTVRNAQRDITAIRAAWHVRRPSTVLVMPIVLYPT